MGALAELRTHFPILSTWAHWCYGGHTKLFFGNFELASATGVQQGDPLGLLLFALCIHPLVLQLDRLLHEGPHADHAALSLFYLDDGIICGSADTVSEALKLIVDESSRLGLKLKISKCELLVPAGQTSKDLSALFPRGLLVDPDGRDQVIWSGGFEFLGAPVGKRAFSESHTAERVQQAKKLLAAISELPDF